ncbi:hypothetical protein BXZ70DRAFT_1068979 [Cristinia sonorae]|uniref:CBS domain-containing protein n=1 Tax=Cristinia sonorae TaxID=1940300 RepID=A0A8K0UDV2_9AGAR|nr:hypothetical protein BXZ70DRAFT_1068979 [Cristinia sonorae]
MAGRGEVSALKLERYHDFVQTLLPPFLTTSSMSLGKRLSVSSIRSNSPLSFAAAPNADAEGWTKTWSETLAKDLIDCPVVSVDAETTVEEACEILLAKDVLCLTVTRCAKSSSETPDIELFDFSDVNAFLTLAATQHRFTPEELLGKPRIQQIVAAAKAGRVPVHLVSSTSESPHPQFRPV